MERTAIVIGGGLAGLAAARELACSGAYRVTVLEVEPNVGGRALTKTINETAIDFGGFIIYPWYTHFHGYIREFGLRNELHPIPQLPIFYDLHGDGQYIEKLDHPYRAFRPFQLLRNLLLPALIFQNPVHPRLDGFKKQTVHEILHSCQRDPDTESDLENYFNVVSQGYCYGPLVQQKAIFGIPAITKSRLFGDVKKSHYLKNGLRTLTDALSAEIVNHGGTIRTNSPALDISPETQEVHLGRESLKADIIIMAQPYNHLTQKALNQDATKNPCPYTHFAVVTVKLSDTPAIKGKKNWGAIFYKRAMHRGIQILSSINLATLYGDSMKHHVNLNVRFNHPALFPPKEDLFEILYGSIKDLFPDVVPESIVESQFWPNTMPIAEESLVEHIRNNQGKQGIFYAGDYLGCPSMETAIATGKHAAALAIKQSA